MDQLLVKRVVIKQMDVMMSLGEVSLGDLSDDELFWTPTDNSWTVRPGEDGCLVDWEEPEPGDSGVRSRRRAPPHAGSHDS